MPEARSATCVPQQDTPTGVVRIGLPNVEGVPSPDQTREGHIGARVEVESVVLALIVAEPGGAGDHRGVVRGETGRGMEKITLSAERLSQPLPEK